jgi:hypothetical protein
MCADEKTGEVFDDNVVLNGLHGIIERLVMTGPCHTTSFGKLCVTIHPFFVLQFDSRI